MFTFTVPASALDGTSPVYSPPASWVKPLAFNPRSPINSSDAGANLHWLLFEKQINAAEHEVFVHSIRQILTTVGVENGSTLSIPFNPGYETLTLHWVRIWRGNQQSNRLDTNNVKIVQQEKELDQLVLNGEKNAVLVLSDVRVGDVLDYSYSIKGENPVFSGHFSQTVPVQFGQPADRLLTRVLWPSQKHLYAKGHGCTVRPVVIPGKETIEYIWDFKQVPGVAAEDMLPPWSDPEPWVQLSDFRTWTEVNEWASALFHVDSTNSPEMSRKIAEWKRILSRDEQIQTVLRFVQDEVRYFGIEIGVSTEKPADPSVVFARRFGDCKDKSLLFVTIMRSLGIQSYPVLVNASITRAIEDWQPSDGAFDHCIAYVQCEGQTYWIDPTMTYQRGPLATHFLPNYGWGLVIAPKTTALTAIPRTTSPTQQFSTEYFKIRGKTEMSELKVVTIAEGGEAERLREYFAATKRGEIERSYTHYYSELYPGAKMSSPIVFDDNQELNKVQTTEFYSIDKVWVQSDKDKKYRCEFYPSSIAGLLKKPVDKDRRQPLGITFPQHRTLRIEATLPDSWPYDTEDKTFSDPAFTFHRFYRCSDNKLVMVYEYKSLDDSVAPERVGQYIQQVNQSTQSLGYTFIWR